MYFIQQASAIALTDHSKTTSSSSNKEHTHHHDTAAAVAVTTAISSSSHLQVEEGYSQSSYKGDNTTTNSNSVKCKHTLYDMYKYIVMCKS